MEKFNVENFNAEEVLREVEEKVKKPNILICGATGVGKSSLVNDFFGITEASFFEGDRVILGPGPMTAHEANEHITVESLDKTAEIYSDMIQMLCGK